MGFDFKAFKAQEPAFADMSDEDTATALYINKYRDMGVTQEKFLSTIERPEFKDNLDMNVQQYDYDQKGYNPLEDLGRTVSEFKQNLKIGGIDLAAGLLNMPIQRQDKFEASAGILDVDKTLNPQVAGSDLAKFMDKNRLPVVPEDQGDLPYELQAPSRTASLLGFDGKPKDLGASDVVEGFENTYRKAQREVEKKAQRERAKQIEIEWNKNPLSRLSRGVIQSGVSSRGLGILTAVATGNPTIGMLAMGELSGGKTFYSQLEAGIDPKVAAIGMEISAGAEIFGESLVLPGQIGALKGGTTWGGVARMFFENMGQEMVTGIIQNPADSYVRYREKGLGVVESIKKALIDGVMQVPEEGLIGGVSGAIMVAPGTLHGANQQRKATKLRADRIEKLKALKQQLTDSAIEQVKQERADLALQAEEAKEAKNVPVAETTPVQEVDPVQQVKDEERRKFFGLDLDSTTETPTEAEERAKFFEKDLDFTTETLTEDVSTIEVKDNKIPAKQKAKPVADSKVKKNITPKKKNTKTLYRAGSMEGELLHLGTEAAATAAAEGRSVNKYEVDIANPAVMEDSGRAHDKNPVAMAEDLVANDKNNLDKNLVPYIKKIQKDQGNEAANAAIKAYLLKMGYDGIEYNNTNEDAGSKSYVAFSKNQVLNEKGKPLADQRSTDETKTGIPQENKDWFVGFGPNEIHGDIVQIPNGFGYDYIDVENLPDEAFDAINKTNWEDRRILYMLSYGLNLQTLKDHDSKLAEHISGLMQNGLVEKAGPEYIANEPYVLTALGEEVADRINRSKFVMSATPGVGDGYFEKGMRKEYRNFNRWSRNNPNANAEQLVQAMYDNRMLNPAERKLWEAFFKTVPEVLTSQTILEFSENHPGRMDTAGEFDPTHTSAFSYMQGKADIIRLFNTRSAQTFIHEFGHKIFFRFMSLEDLANLEDMWKKSKSYKVFLNQDIDNFEKYANSFGEWVAESFNLYVNDKVDSNIMKGIFRGALDKLQSVWASIKKFKDNDAAVVKFFDDYLQRKEFTPVQEAMQNATGLNNLYASNNRYNLAQDVTKINQETTYDKIPTYEEMNYDTLMERSEAGDIQAQKELDFRISQFETTPVRDKDRKELLNQAHQVERSTKLDPETIAKAKKGLFGKDSMTWMTDEEVKQYMKEIKRLAEIVNDPKHAYNMATTESGLDSETVSRFDKASDNNQTAVAMILNKRKMLGGYSKDSDIMKRQVDRDITNTKVLVKWDKKVQDAMEKNNHEKNFINQWVSMRYAMNLLDLRSGFPIYQLFEKINEESVVSEHQAVKEIKKLLAEPGKFTGTPMTFDQIASMNLQSPLINKALFEEDTEARQKLFDQLTDKQKDLYYKMHQLLQGDAANQIREVRWWEWNRAMLRAEQAPTKSEYTKRKKVADELMPPDIKDNEVEQKRLLKEGRDAMRLDNLSEWIAGENFGTREYYFPSENKDSSTVLNDLLDIPEANLQDSQKRGMKKLSLRAERSRKGQSLARTQPVLQVVLNHYRRALLRNATKSESVQMNEMLKQVDLSTRDIGHLNNWMSNVLGKPMKAGDFTKAAEAMNNIFWRNFGVHMSSILHFVGRNLLQSSWLLGQQNVGDVLQSAMRVWTGHATENTKRAFKDRWVTISQKGAITEEQMALGQASERSITKTFKTKVGHKYSKLQQWANRLMPFSDSTNRGVVYPILHETAQRYGKKYQAGKINYNKMRRKLGIDTLSLGQIEKLEQLLSEGNIDDFAHYLAQYKTENTQFKYGRTERSMMEQTRGHRSVMGLATYPRGVFELLWNGTAKPFFKGIKDLDVRAGWQAGYQGVSTVILSRIAMELARGIMGDRDKEDYSWMSLAGFTFLSPGAGILYDLTSETIPQIANLTADYIAGDKSLEETGEAMGNLTSRSLEIVIPMSDVMINAHQALNDTQGQNLWKTARSILDKQYARKYKRRHKYKREDLETFQMILFGGNRKDNNRQDDVSRMDEKEQAAWFLTGARPEK